VLDCSLFCTLLLFPLFLGPNVRLSTVFLTTFDVGYFLRIFTPLKLFNVETKTCELAEVLEYTTLNPLIRTVQPDEPSPYFLTRSE
jgi:hypothetical protein